MTRAQREALRSLINLRLEAGVTEEEAELLETIVYNTEYNALHSALHHDTSIEWPPIEDGLHDAAQEAYDYLMNLARYGKEDRLDAVLEKLFHQL